MNFNEMLKILIPSYSPFHKTLGAYGTTVKLTIGKNEQINVKMWNGSGQSPGYPCDKLNTGVDGLMNSPQTLFLQSVHLSVILTMITQSLIKLI